MPARDVIDSEMLAVLLWDVFGPATPRSDRCITHALPGHIEAYRRAANDILASLDFNAAVAAVRAASNGEQSDV